VGHIRLKVDISPPEGGEGKEAVALVDTGATLTVLPKTLAQELNLPRIGTSKVRTGAGILELERARCILRIEGKEIMQDVLVSDIIDKVLIGVVTLGSLGLEVDPVTERIKETELLLY